MATEAAAPPRELSRKPSEQRRLFAACLLFAVAALVYASWRGWWVPREAERIYLLGYRAYEAGDFGEAQVQLERAVKLEPNMTEAQSLLGWTHWRLGELLEAEPHFRAAHEQDTSSFEAKSSLGMVLLALSRIEDALPILEDASRVRPDDAETRLRLAEAYRRSGRNRVAVALYREMLARDSSQFRAERALLEMFGYASLGPEATFTHPRHVRPETLQVHFRTQGDYFQVMDGGRWRNAYLTGANIGPGRPGEWAVAASLEPDTYRGWLRQIADAGANTVRVYTILPPAFYRALEAHNREAAEPLWLIQEVWLPDDALDLYDPTTMRDFERELRAAIDVLHGQADIGCRTGHYCGMYTSDLSSWTIGIGVGREVEPRIVRATNRLNPDKSSYRGTYVSLADGSPSEAWFAHMFDVAAAYETETYNAQRPLTIVSWPPLDPLTHPTEAAYAEELAIRKAKGETVPDSIPIDMNDMDAVSVHVVHFRTEPAFQSGLFALYHVYQHWPDFMFLEESFAEAQDAEGPNRYLGYLQALKNEHQGFPLLIGEYGASTSQTPAHLHPDGWHNGGLSEEEQARLLARFTRNIHDSRMAGGIVFEWTDEWWKQVHDEFTAPLELRTNDPLWANVLDPEEFFGIVGYRPYQIVPLLRGAAADWLHADTLYRAPNVEAQDGEGSPSPIRAVYATTDYGYLYLRVDLDVASQIDWSHSALRIPLNTLPGESGSTVLPDGIRIESGANFLVELNGLAEARLLMAANYDPWHTMTNPGREDLPRLDRRVGMSLAIGEAPFGELTVEVNQPRWARDGREYAPIRFSHSRLPQGTADPDGAGYSSRAMWHVDPETGMVEFRIPWLMLLITDPVDRMVFAGTDSLRVARSKTSPGVAVSVLAFRASVADSMGAPTLELMASLPAESGGRLAPLVYEWKTWERVRYTPYLKPSYYELQSLWRGWPRFMD